jgi:hypothetical protein
MEMRQCSLCLTPPRLLPPQDFLEALAEVVPPNNSAVVNYRRMYVPLSLPAVQAADEPLKTIVLMKHVQVGGAGGSVLCWCLLSWLELLLPQQQWAT